MDQFNKNMRRSITMENQQHRKDFSDRKALALENGQMGLTTEGSAPTFESDERVERRKTLKESGAGFGDGPREGEWKPPEGGSKPWLDYYESGGSSVAQRQSLLGGDGGSGAGQNTKRISAANGGETDWTSQLLQLTASAATTTATAAMTTAGGGDDASATGSSAGAIA